MKLKENRKLQIVVFVVSMVVLCGIYFPLSAWIENSVVRDKVLKKSVSENNNVLVGVTETKEDEKKLIISGWAVHLDAELQGIKVILLPLNGEAREGLVLNATLNQSATLQEYMEYLAVKNTKGSGFTAEIGRDKLAQDVCYEIQVYVNYEQEEEQTIKNSSKKYLYNGQIYPYNPREFSIPVFLDEQMAEVVENGYLLGYTMEHGAWVYQYEGCLYWILDKCVGANSDEELYMFYHIYTPHTELLPENRKTYGFDNKDFDFKVDEMEIQEGYRVAMKKLDMQYPVTYIATGQYAEGKNLWVMRNRVEIQK